MAIPKVPEDFYTGLGKVVVATTSLEYQVAFLVTLLNGHDVVMLDNLFTSWGKLKAAYEEAKNVLPSMTEQIEQLMEDVEVLRQERNSVAHALVILNQPDDEDTESITFVQYHARGLAIHALPTKGELRNLELRLGALAARTVMLQQAAASELGRDEVPGDGQPGGITFGRAE